VASAIEQTKYTRYYDPSYVNLGYPGGDVPLETGVCADVIVRAFRETGIDLQKAIYEDMTMNFRAYPQRWGLSKPDANIDHRRVANQMTYFERQGKSIPISGTPADYRPGDVVAWDLGNGRLHIGIVTNVISRATGTPKVVHNIDQGARLEERLFEWNIIGHYRYLDSSGYH